MLKLGILERNPWIFKEGLLTDSKTKSPASIIMGSP